MTVLVDDREYNFIKYRSFIYKGKKFTVFADPDMADDDGIPYCYCLQAVVDNRRYTPPCDEDAAALSEFVLSLTCDISFFDRNFEKELGVKLLPLGE